MWNWKKNSSSSDSAVMQMDDAGQRTDERLRRQLKVLNELSTLKLICEDSLQAAFQKITEAVADAVEVARVSIWLFNENNTKITCSDLYEREEKQHSEGLVLTATNFPRYFEALQEKRAIAASDAKSDPRTAEFSSTYLTPLGITSMLNAPIRRSDRIIGVICCEHVGEPRDWELDEQFFAGSIADNISIVIDEKERDKRERTVRFLSSVVEQATDGMAVADLFGNVLFVNNAWTQMHGYELKKELLGKHLSIFYTDEQNETVIKPILENIEEKDSYDKEITHVKKDNIPFPTRTSITLLRDSSNQPIAISVVSRDISLRKSAEDALRESEAKFRLISEQSIMGISILQDDTFKYVNQAASDIFGHSIEELTSWEPGKYKEYIHPDDRAFVSEQAKKKQAGDEDVVRNYSWRMLTNTGLVKWIELYSTPIMYEGRIASLASPILPTGNVRKKLCSNLKNASKVFSITLLLAYTAPLRTVEF